MLEGNKGLGGAQGLCSSRVSTELPAASGIKAAAPGKTIPAPITAVMCWQGEGRHKARAQLTY